MILLNFVEEFEEKMKNLLMLFCGIIVFVFCACASQTQSTQKADKDERNLAKLKAECEKNNAKSCYDLGSFIAEESEKSGNDEKSFDTQMLNSAKNYFLKSCDLNYANGCFSYSMWLMFSGFNELNSAEKENKKLAYKKLSKYLPTFIKYNQKACDLGSVNGCDELGSGYWSGEGVKKDRKMAFKLFKKSCDLAQSHEKIAGSFNEEIARARTSCKRVGRIYYNGEEGIGKNRQLALEYFYKACEVNVFECGMSAESFYKKQDYDFAFNLAQKGCEVGDDVSCNYLGILYQEGKGTTQDLNKAFWAFQKLCYWKKDYGTIGMKQVGCFNLALCYANGQGVEQDYKRAFNSFKELCDKNEMSSACAIMGEYYYNAQGVRQDYRKAMEYFGKACDMGEQSGCDNHKMMKQTPFRYGLKDEDFK